MACVSGALNAVLYTWQVSPSWAWTPTGPANVRNISTSSALQGAQQALCPTWLGTDGDALLAWCWSSEQLPKATKGDLASVGLSAPLRAISAAASV